MKRKKQHKRTTESFQPPGRQDSFFSSASLLCLATHLRQVDIFTPVFSSILRQESPFARNVSTRRRMYFGCCFWSVFVKILQKNWLGVFLPLKNLSRGFAPTLRYPRIFFKHE